MGEVSVTGCRTEEDPHHHANAGLTPFQTASPKGSDLGQSRLDPAVPET